MTITLRYEEDLLLFREWFIEILNHHCFPIYNTKPSVSTHVVSISKREIDVVVKCRDKRICIELKNWDIGKAVEQAINYVENLGCDYVYVVLNLHIDTILDTLRTNPNLAKKIFEHGIGIVSAVHNAVIFKAFKRKTASTKFMNLLELMNKAKNNNGE